MVLLPLVFNGVAAFLYCTIPIWNWHFRFKNYLLGSLQLFNSSSENDPPIWPSGGAQIPQKLKNLFDPFDGVQNLKPVGEEV